MKATVKISLNVIVDIDESKLYPGADIASLAEKEATEAVTVATMGEDLHRRRYSGSSVSEKAEIITAKCNECWRLIDGKWQDTNPIAHIPGHP